MDFFEKQDRAHRSTNLLVFYFVLAVALLVLAIYLGIVLVLSGTNVHVDAAGRPYQSIWQPKLFAGVALSTIGVILFGSLFKTLQLRRGGSAVAEMLGGRLIGPNTANHDERKLLNIVEEMALASGMPVPQVYVMDDENGINAFAAGHSPGDAAIGVTKGCISILNRDELQGVIAHEFSHILNGDMRLNLRLMGIVFGILCLTVIGRVLLRTRSGGRSRDRNPLPLIGLILLLVGWIGVVFGRLIQAAVSRQREFLADASAVQFTRNPGGIAGALKKIGGLGSMGSRLQAAHAEEASHMFFGNGISQPFIGLFATHPPLEDRIRAIEPSFDGKFPSVRYKPDKPAMDDLVSGLDAGPAFIARRETRFIVEPPPIPPGSAIPGGAIPTVDHLRYAVELRDSFPTGLQTAARDPMGAEALVLGLVLSTNPETRAKQIRLISESSPPLRMETERLLPELAPVAVRARLPLVELALPSLRQLSTAQYEQFNHILQQLIESDDEIDLFEYVLQKIVRRHLAPQFTERGKQVIQYYAIRALTNECGILLSALAHFGHSDPAEAERAFVRGAQRLSYQARAPIGFVPASGCDLPQIDDALNRLAQAVPQIKKNVLNACAETAAADGLIHETEAELLRAIADTLDCPLPPLIKT